MTQYLKNRLTFLAENRLFADPQEGEYALEFLRCLEKEMDPRKHWLFQKREMTARLLKLIEDNIPLDARARKKVRDLLKNQWDLNFGSSFAELDICLRRVKRVGLIRSEGPVKVAWYVPEFMPDPGRHLPSLEEAIWVHQSLDRLDETRDLDQLMQGILDFEVKIRANCKP
jgi:hypothetical protein